jgi:YfiH family protein
MDAVVPHLFTTRHWQLGQRAAGNGDDESAWADVADALTMERRELARAHQVHGADIVTVRPGGTAALPDADILLARGGMGCAIQTADCVPLLLVDSGSGVVVSAHAGWRGLAQRVPRVAALALVSETGVRPADLLVAIGPAIGPCCYEVGDEVREAFAKRGFDPGQCDGWFRQQPARSARNPGLPQLSTAGRPGHWYFDMWRAAREQFADVGVRSERIYSADLCTASHPDTFCSYRRDGRAAGRTAAAIRSVVR